MFNGGTRCFKTIFSLGPSLVDLIPGSFSLHLPISSPSSYPFISPLASVSTYKLTRSRVMSNTLHISVSQNGGEMNGIQMNGGQMNNGQLNNSQSSGRQMNGVQLNSHQSSRSQMNTGQNLVVRMLITKDLQIKHVDGLNPGEANRYWKCVSLRESRFVEALEALQVWVLRVEAKIKLEQLSPETNYAAYLIFKTKPNSKGLDTYQRALVYSDGYRWEKNVCISPGVVRPGNKCNVYPVKRSDGWMELELGQFYCDGDAGEVGLCLEEADTKNKMTGLIISGIEVRPF